MAKNPNPNSPEAAELNPAGEVPPETFPADELSSEGLPNKGFAGNEPSSFNPGVLPEADTTVTVDGFPTEFPETQAQDLIKALLSQNFDSSPKLAFDAWYIVGFGLGKVLGQPTSPKKFAASFQSFRDLDTTSVPAHTLNNKSAAALLQSALEAHQGEQEGKMQAFDPANWMKLAQFLVPIILKIFAGK